MVPESKRVDLAAAHTVEGAAPPKIAQRKDFERQLDVLRVREKEPAQPGDAIAAERRRSPMLEVNRSTKLIGGNGPVTLLDASGGRKQLIACYFMRHTGHPAKDQRQGRTRVTR